MARLAVAIVVAALAVVGLAPGAAAQDVQEDAGGTAASFEDVTGGVHKPAIDALTERGLFDGTECGQDMFCPGDEMKRWTMAVWLVRVLDEAEPAAATESSFADVDVDNRWLAHIERLAELEVTTGCLVDPLRFCPNRSVNRAEMATFLERAFDLEAADPAGFADTAGNFHEANIDALAAARITVGCQSDPLRYCPDQPVTRAEMATFLARALGLVEVPAPADPAEGAMIDGELTAAVEADAADAATDEPVDPTATDPTAPDPSMCRPPGTPYTTAGFPLPPEAAPSIGTMRVAVLFIDFPDAVATYRTQDEATLGLPYAEAYLEAVSYGRLDVEFVPLHGWLRAEHSFTEYLGEVDLGDMRVFASAEAIRLADPSFDFTGIHAVMTVLPSSRFQAGDHTFGSAHTDEGEMTLLAGINTVPLDEPRDPEPWGYVAAHELAHSLGLTDLYPYDAARFERPEPPAPRIWVRSEFGLMGLHTAFVAHPDDRRIEITGRGDFGRRLTGHTFQLEAIEMLAWSRWQLGWLDESQVLCLTADRSRVVLSPVADPGDAAVMAAVPLSDTEVLVAEVRVKVGYDAEQEEPHTDGALLTVPALATEGVLVYVVDASLASGQLPVVIAGDSGNGQVDDYPILTRGEQVVVRGYTVTLVSDRGGAYIVAIFRVEA
ncbi:MAG: hypothetical protein F4Z34_00815 [Acidimicrobiaceae bacterium]|nr:hypothetical protein [Acidimicrobiaceae bacterium]